MIDAHSRWNHRWLTPKAKPSESKIAGNGSVAVSDIRKGEVVLVIGGLIIPKKDILEYHKEVSALGIQVDDDFFLCPASHDDSRDIGGLNHSCAPNCGFKNSIVLAATRDIKRGEELTFDYATSESYRVNFDCKCGSSNCRKHVTPNDWKIPELQRRYKGYFSPYLQAKIDSLKH